MASRDKKRNKSCDWDRTAFTMDETRSESVIKVFVDLYNKGLIYRGVRMVNWDPKAKTALSDEEVVYKEEHSKLYYLRYKIEGEAGYAVVATTRPETIMRSKSYHTVKQWRISERRQVCLLQICRHLCK